MTIESLGRKNGPKPGEHGVAAARHGRRPQPEPRDARDTRDARAAVPTARPKPAPPRPPANQMTENEAAKTDPPTVRERQGPMQKRGRNDTKPEGQNRGGDRSLYDGGSPSANRLGPAKAMRARDVSRPRDL